MVGFTLANPLTNPLKLITPAALFPGLAVGDILEEVVVQSVEKGRGVYFKLRDKCFGFGTVNFYD